MRFIHTADLHIGAKVSSKMEKKAQDFLYDNQLKVLYNIIDITEEKKADALFIAGDLFDSEDISQNLVSKTFDALKKVSCEVFISCGNHDPLTSSSMYVKNEIPNNVHIFKTEAEKFSYDTYDIYGMSFSASHKTDNSFHNFYVDDYKKTNIMVIHGELKSDSFYNPINKEEIESAGISYLALGHIHKACDIERLNNMHYAYSGAPQSTTFKEMYKGSVIYGEIENGNKFFERIPVYLQEFKEVIIDITGVATNDEIIKKITYELLKYNILKTFFKVILKGRVEETLEYREDEILSAFKDDFLYVEIKKEFKIKYDLSLLKKEQSIKGEFIRNALTYLSGKDDDYISDVIEYGVKNL